MSPLLAPLLAQLISLQVEDRTEARYVKQSTGRYEGTTTPGATLSIDHSRSRFALAYAPSLSLVPLERSSRELYVFHLMSASAGYKLSRRTTLTFANTFGIGSINFRVLGLQGPQAANVPVMGTDSPPAAGAPSSGAPPIGTPSGGAPMGGATPGGLNTPGGLTRPDVYDRKVRYYTFTSSLNLAHQITKHWRANALVGTMMASGRDDESRLFYPALRGWFVGGSTGYTYDVGTRDSFTSALSLMKTWSSNDNEVATLIATETWAHQLAKRTASWLGAGLTVTRFSQANGLRGLSVFPTFNAGLTHQERVGRGTLNLGATAFSSPALDPLRAIADPRVGAGANIGYLRKKFAIGASGATAFSIAPTDNNAGAVNFASGEARASYLLAELTQVDTGARFLYQTYGGNTVFPVTWAAFVGLTVGYQVQLSGRRK